MKSILEWAGPETSMDFFVAAYLVVFTLLAGGANFLNLPLFNRASGGMLSYSKFAKNIKFGIDVPSRLGMTLLYLPAVPVAYMTLQNHPDSPRAALMAVLMIVHFGKRTLECLFLHKYSGSMPLTSSIFISSWYTPLSYFCVHYAARARPMKVGHVPVVALGLFLTGVAGNGYHHWLLANLRKPGEKGYKIPMGGFFPLVAAPHYFFELIGWVGVTLVSEHLLIAGATFGMTVYLFDRAVGQTLWNRRKLENYPETRRHIVPYIF